MHRTIGRSLSLVVLSALVSACGADMAADPGFTTLSSSSATGGSASTSGTDTVTTSSSSSTSGPELLGPPYPIVLAHGFFGFEDFAGLNFINYFYQVREHLAQQGETAVFTPAVDPFNDSEYRGAQLAAKVEEILAQTGHAKVNLIGHSQGGLDARVVAFEHPELVASVITLQTPHDGSRIADIALELIDDPYLQDVLDFLVQVVGMPLYDEVGQQTSLAASLMSFSHAGIEAFNAKYEDSPGIYYASIAGRSDWHYGGSDCHTSSGLPFISAFDSELDPIDPLFEITEMLLDGGLTDPYPNDGLVRVQDAKHGEFLGCVPADHMDMVGHLFGDSPGFGNDWDYLQFYVDLVQFLRDKGL